MSVVGRRSSFKRFLKNKPSAKRLYSVSVNHSESQVLSNSVSQAHEVVLERKVAQSQNEVEKG